MNASTWLAPSIHAGVALDRGESTSAIKQGPSIPEEYRDDAMGEIELPNGAAAGALAAAHRRVGRQDRGLSFGPNLAVAAAFLRAREGLVTSARYNSEFLGFC